VSRKDDDKHDKKKIQRKKNLKNWIIFKQVEEQLKQVDSAAPAMEAPPPPAPHQEVWSAKVQEHRNMITGKRRAAQDRWNRFAGTSGGGGRGR
jgi:hypothetical protein